MADFETTNWSLVRRAGISDSEQGTRALGDLLEAYYPALHRFLRLQKRLSPDQADDLLQGFIADKVLEKELLNKADQSKGKFRTFLIRALDHYQIDCHRAASAKKRSSGQLESLDDSWHQDAEKADGTDADVFELTWARNVMEETVDSLRKHCEGNDQRDIFGVFELRVLRPMTGTAPVISYEDLVRRFDFKSPAQAANALVTAKRQFKRFLEASLAKYLDEGEVIEAGLVELRQVLSQAPPRTWQFVTEEELRESSSRTGSRWIHSTSSAGLASLIGLNDHPDGLWRNEELHAVWGHQCTMPFEELAPEAPEVRTDLENARLRTGRPLRTIGDVLHDSAAPLSAINEIKRFGRRLTHRPEGGVSSEIASAIYSAAIAAALVHHQVRISRLDDHLLREGFELANSRAWLDPKTRILVKNALRELEKPGSMKVG